MHIPVGKIKQGMEADDIIGNLGQAAWKGRL